MDTIVRRPKETEGRVWVGPASRSRREPSLSSRRTRGGEVIEWCLAFAILVSIAYLVIFLAHNGYLPSPFYAKNLTLLDWFDTLFWSRNAGAYTHWQSVYPPLSFLFARLFSNPACYIRSSVFARTCDLRSAGVLLAFLAAGFVLTFLALRKPAGRGALPRTIAVCLGSSMFYGLERGNLVLVAYPFFVLGFSSLLRRGWLRIACGAVALNFKPYVLMAAVGWLSRRRWAWLASIFAVSGGLYLASWAAFGAGSPVELLRNMTGPLRVPERAGLDLIQFSSSYDSLLLVLQTPGALPFRLLPLPFGVVRAAVFLVIASGWIGWWACCLGAARRPSVLTSQRLAAISLAVLFSICTPGAYSLIFLLFLVFLEPWTGVGRRLALVAAYLWCIPFDPALKTIGVHAAYSFLGQRVVQQETALTLGQLVRPALILIVEFGLIGTTLAELRRGWRQPEGGRARTMPDLVPPSEDRRAAA